MAKIKNLEQYNWAVSRVEQIMDSVDESTPSDNPSRIELELLSELVSEYSEEHLPMTCSLFHHPHYEPQSKKGHA